MKPAQSKPCIDRLGDFEILHELGRGGMGIVYEARQVSLNRKVALKVLNMGLGLTGQAVTRFRREAAAAAKLHHTNIVPIYATGDSDGMHFYAMELIDGPSLDKVIKGIRREQRPEVRSQKSEIRNQKSEGTKPRTEVCEQTGTASNAETIVGGSPRSVSDLRPLNPDLCLSDTTTSLKSGSGYFDIAARMMAEVADGLDYAHKQGVIHRDVKPANLLLSPEGRLSINDFGLARMLEEPGMTMTGEFMGSPAYMSPEQITAGRIKLDHRTDIYSLGAALYELLTLQPPFTGQSRDQVLAQIMAKEPKSLRSVNKKVPLDLETICLKAMEKDPDRRYQTAGAMAEDLRRFVNRFAISARRANPVQRMVKWAQRHPASAVAAGITFLAVVLVGLFAQQARSANQRLLEEQRRGMIQEAVLAARRGDMTSAQTAIDHAETLGASAGEVRMLRGQAALFQQRPAVAIRELEQAVRLLPQSVAAKALLAQACVDSGMYDRMFSLVQELAQMTPKTAEDFLFLGQAVSNEDSERALRNLDEGVRRGDSVLARLLRADARARHALLTRNPADASHAAEDIQAARAMCPDDPAVIERSLFVRRVTAQLLGFSGSAAEQQAELARAGRDAEALARTPNPTTALARARYLAQIGDEEAALRELEPHVAGESAMMVLWYYADLHYWRGEFAHALAAIEKQPDQGGMELAVIRSLLLAELPGGPDRAYEVIKKSGTEKASSWHAIFGVSVLQLLGRSEEAREIYQRLCERMRYPFRDHWLERLLEYGAGRRTDAELIALAGKSQWCLCEAHFYIGMKHLSEEDRFQAREHFRRSEATGVFIWFEHERSRGFLRRMEANPNWPPWIPIKESKVP